MNQYFTKSYNHKGRWLSYFYQFESILGFKDIKKVLEIGKGNGLLSKVLAENKLEVVTLDNDEKLNPDIVGDMRNLPFPDGYFDASVAFEVLEHLPFDQFPIILKEFKRVSRKYIIISLPDHSRTILKFLLKIPFIKEKIFHYRICNSEESKKYWPPCGHFWEMGFKEYPDKKVKEEIVNCGLKIINDFVPYDSPWTHYFLIEKPSR